MKKQLAASLLILSTQLYAVDGYKDLKFGMTKKQVMNSGLCSFQALSASAVNATEDFLNCFDLRFFGEQRIVKAYFVDDAFKRLQIQVNPSEAGAIIDGLQKKYGPPSQSPTGKAIDPTEIKQNPNATGEVWFDNNTVVFELSGLNQQSRYASLSYQAPDYKKPEKPLHPHKKVTKKQTHLDDL